MVAWKLPPEVAGWIATLAGLLHGRLGHRLAPLMIGMLFARGRQTVSSWLRAGGLGRDFRAYYYFLGSIGRKVKWLSALVFDRAVRAIGVPDRLLIAIDDTPTKRYGPHVEGAGIHHNPTPGPADQQFVYGHIWVTMSWIVQHPLWGAIGLPLRALMYVRQKDVPKIPRRYGVAFRTKLTQAVELIHWVAEQWKRLNRPITIVTDGAYAKRPVLNAVRDLNLTMVSRLRHDAALWSVPEPQPGRRGRPRKYGPDKLSLAKRAGHRQGWSRDEFLLYGCLVEVTYKTFLATYKPASGLIRVVLVREEDRSWRAYFSTDAEQTVGQILNAVADRSAIEQNFHDLKEVHGTGQQQVRHYFANVAVYHLILWWHTFIELWAWHRPKHQICDRRRSPWDDPTRRPSHADRRNALRRHCLQSEFRSRRPSGPMNRKIRRLCKTILQLIT